MMDSPMTDAELEAETLEILVEFPSKLARRSGGGWLVGIGSREGAIEHVGHTGIDPATSDDPRDMARRLYAMARPPAPIVDEPLNEDEDPGEQPEIFTEEDVEALGAVAVESEASQDADTPAAPAPDTEGLQGVVNPDAGAADSPAYPGIMTLPDELGARRNAVLAAITTEKLTRLSIAMDPSRADFLAARFADYQNAGALGLPIDEALAADYRAFQELRDRRDRITNYAMQLEQSALDGDMDRLEAMHAGLGDGWP